MGAGRCNFLTDNGKLPTAKFVLAELT